MAALCTEGKYGTAYIVKGSFASITIDNIARGSPRLWASCLFTIINTVYVIYTMNIGDHASAPKLANHALVACGQVPVSP